MKHGGGCVTWAQFSVFAILFQLEAVEQLVCCESAFADHGGGRAAGTLGQ